MDAESSGAAARRPALSSLRLRLAAVFTGTFVASLALIAIVSLGWLWRESTHRLDQRLDALTLSAARAIDLEQAEYPDSSRQAIVQDVQREWVVGPDAWLAIGADGSLLGATADTVHRRRVLAAHAADPNRSDPLTLEREGDDLRIVTRIIHSDRGLPPYTLLAVGSTEGIERDTELLLFALAIAAPLIVLISLGAGYMLSRWALRPAHTLGQSIDALGPAAPAARLPVTEPVDEIGQLAQRFNALLDRLAVSQAQNRAFVRDAAHQIRTPLTLVRGEAEYSLATPSPDVAQLQATLSRIERASRQMQRRVDELLLLAEAEAGAVLEQRTAIELDALALEAVDMFRARASQLGRALAYGALDAAVVMGDEALLRESLLELLENACRHGRQGTTITVSVRCADEGVHLVVESQRRRTDPTGLESASTGLGQRIVRWIAGVHGGRFTVQHEPSEHYAAVLSLPVAATPPTAAPTRALPATPPPGGN